MQLETAHFLDELEKQQKAVSKPQDETIWPQIDPMDLELGNEMLSNKGTGVVVDEGQRIWFNQN